MHDHTIEPAFLSIADAARWRGESVWRIKQLLRQGILKAKKSGRRTLVSFSSLKASIQGLPDAEFTKPRRKAQPIRGGR